MLKWGWIALILTMSLPSRWVETSTDFCFWVENVLLKIAFLPILWHFIVFCLSGFLMFHGQYWSAFCFVSKFFCAFERLVFILLKLFLSFSFESFLLGNFCFLWAFYIYLCILLFIYFSQWKFGYSLEEKEKNLFTPLVSINFIQGFCQSLVGLKNIKFLSFFSTIKVW